jgi:hypothetical protein
MPRLLGGLTSKSNKCHEDITPGFKAKPNAHSMCAQESSLHTYHTKNGYRITNVTIYNIYYQIISYKRLSRTLSETSQRKELQIFFSF